MSLAEKSFEEALNMKMGFPIDLVYPGAAIIFVAHKEAKP